MNYSTTQTELPTPNGAIKKLPVVVRDRMPHVSMPAAEIRERAIALLAEYQKDLIAIASATGIEEAKYYSVRADALAAWAKTYKNDELAIAARREKLLAFRRMGEIATQMAEDLATAARQRAEAERPAKIAELVEQRAAARASGDKRQADRIDQVVSKIRTGRNLGSESPWATQPAPLKVLRAAGLTKGQATTAVRAARLPEPTFKAHVEAGRGTSAVTQSGRGTGQRGGKPAFSASYHWLLNDNGGARLSPAIPALRRRRPGDVAAGITQAEAKELRPKILELIEWLDAFEQALPKDKP